MPTASAASTSQRLLALLSLLQARRDWPAALLADRLGVSERTVRRDIERLRDLDYTIDATRGPDGGYRLGVGNQLPPLILDDEQAVAIAIALQGAGALGAGIADAAERALSTISRTMPAHLQHRVAGLALSAAARSPGGAESDPAVLLAIGRAIRDSEELRFDYASAGASVDGGAPARRTQPHHLLLHSGRWYLIGYSTDSDDWRVYRVDRIAPRSHTGRPFTPREVPGGDAARYLTGRFQGSSTAGTWPCWGEVVLAAPVAAIAPYIGDGVVEPVDDKRCKVRLGAWSWAGLAASIARFDADIEVLSPPQLAAAFTALAARMAAAGGGAAT